MLSVGGDVERDAPRRSPHGLAQRSGDGFGGVAVDVGDDEVVAGAREFGGDAGADAAAGTGDEDAAWGHGGDSVGMPARLVA
jgi:hypothetical protein